MVIMSDTIYSGNIKKVIVKKGFGKAAFPESSKVTVHFKTYIPATCKKDEVLLDDSRTFKMPFELLIGKRFKLPCWEECIKTMTIGEIARFRCPKKCVVEYPVVSKSLRNLHHGKVDHGHSCGLHAMEAAYGYEDLNNLHKNMNELEFEFELLKVEEPHMYQKELWQMDSTEMIASIPKFHEQGNELFKSGQVNEAEKKYANAIGCLKHLQLKERPGTEKWVQLDKRQITLLLNHAQCKLLKEEYTMCINNCTEVLEKIDGNNNVKALFKRGKAYACILEEKECHADFSLALRLDPTIAPAVRREVRSMEQRMKHRDRKLSSYLKGMFD